MNGSPVARSHPQAAAFPPRVGIVDAAVDLLGEKSHRVGDAQFDDAAVHERVQRIRLVAGGYRRIGAEPERVVLINP